MIKVNLKSAGSAGKSFVADVDFSGVNFKNLIICFLLGFGPQWFVLDELWNTEVKEQQAIISKLKAKKKQVDIELKKSENVRAKLAELKLKQETLSKKLSVVNEVVKKQNNPMKILLYIAENIPSEVWIEEMNLMGRRLTFKGYSINYKSIGKFIKNLKESIFLNEKVNLEDYKSKVKEGTRVEEFFISSTIESF